MKVLIMSKDGLEAVNLNRRKAIHERCLICTCWIPKEVTGCTFKQCSLHHYSLGKGNQDAAKRQKAIRAYCRWCSNDQVGEVTKCPSNTCPLWIYRKCGLNKAINSPSFEKFDRIGGNFRTNLIKVNIDTTQYRLRKSA